MEKPEAQTRTERCLLRAAASWLLAVSAQTLIAGSTQTGGTVVLTVFLFGALSLAVYLRPVPRLDTWTFAGAVLAAAFIHVAKNSDFYFCLTVIVCLLMAEYLLFARGRLSSGVPELSERAAKRLIAGLAALCVHRRADNASLSAVLQPEFRLRHFFQYVSSHAIRPDADGFLRAGHGDVAL